ncbi:MAG: response regulator [Gammaproteobacteria bacterium]|nr:response regulator [Gammaproteobacteria bacterium]
MEPSSGTKTALPIRILLVEDNDAHTKLILRAMQEDRLANPVDCVRDGEEALDFLYRRGKFNDASKSPRPDMILLDLKLPKIDGLEVLKTIKEDEKLREIPVVVLTSSTDQRDVHEAYRHYVNSYIAKPVDFDKFRQVVQELDYYWTIFNTKPARPLAR